VAKAYKDNEVFTDPQIAIQVKSYAERKVNAIGSVNNPHPVVIPPGEDATLVSVITACGGPASTAGHTVRVTRKLADGRISNFEVNLKDAFKDARKDIPLQDGDTVWLLESPIGGEWVGW
jgi:protein involved in polysaccharide export with SLBB domain